MTTVWLSPVFNEEQFSDNNGVPLAGGKIYAYIAGSFSTEQTMYTDSIGGTPWTQPIVLNSAGRISTGSIWLDSSLKYNLVVYMPDGLTVLKHVDNVSGVPVIVSSGGGGGGVSTNWILVGTPSYVSPTIFTVVGNYTTAFAIGNRVQIQNSDLTYSYGTVSAVAFASGNTQVTLVNDSTVLNVGMATSWYSDVSVNGRVADAGAVTYTSSLSYSIPNTVGHELQNLDAEMSAAQAAILDAYQVWPASAGPARTISPVPTPSSLTVNQIYNVNFSDTGTGGTMNVGGTGALNLKMYNYLGALIPAAVSAGLNSQISYDGTNWILLDQLPEAGFDISTIPHGQVVITSNGTFTPGTGVYNVNVICVGGGGGGGGGNVSGGGESGFTYFDGGGGGSGGSAFKNVNVTPGTGYSVTIGSGGTAGAAGGGVGGAGSSTVFGASTVVGTGGAGGNGASFSANGTPGAGGYDASGAFGLFNVGFSASGVPKGVGGAGGIGSGSGIGGVGTVGVCIVTW